MKKKKTNKKKTSFFGFLLSGIGVVVLFAAALLYGLPMLELTDTTAAVGASDWMAGIPDDRKLSSVNIPGTHDAATKYSDLPIATRCQAATIAEQLEMGYRYLDIRLGENDTLNGLAFYHSFASCREGSYFGAKLSLESVLSECYAFLEAHPTETILFSVKYEYGDLPTEEFELLLNEEIQKDSDSWLTGTYIPTMGESRGKLVLLRRYADAACLEDQGGLDLSWADQAGQDEVNQGLSLALAITQHIQLYVQDRYGYSLEDKWEAFNLGLAEATKYSLEDDMLYIHFLSTTGTAPVGHPYYFAAQLNSRLRHMDLPSGRHIGWVILDFGDGELAEKIYSTNFN